MDTLLTVAAFAIITTIVVWLYLCRNGSCESTRPCPRCHEPVALQRTRCPHCNVPMQAYEITTAKIVTEEPPAETSNGDGEETEKLHAVVRADACVGCATCVSACPIDDAIRLDGIG